MLGTKALQVLSPLSQPLVFSIENLPYPPCRALSTMTHPSLLLAALPMPAASSSRGSTSPTDVWRHWGDMERQGAMVKVLRALQLEDPEGVFSRELDEETLRVRSRYFIDFSFSVGLLPLRSFPPLINRIIYSTKVMKETSVHSTYIFLTVSSHGRHYTTFRLCHRTPVV